MTTSSFPPSHRAAQRHPRTPLRRLFAAGLAVTGLVLLVLSALAGAGFQSVAQAAPAAVQQCNDVANVGGQGITCSVDIVNNLNVATGKTSSTATVTMCVGAANAPLKCTTTPSSSTALTTSVDQCNRSGNGGGGAVRCAVSVVNNITGNTTRRGATVNQCIGSGGGGGTQPTVACDPNGNTTNATITQCNGSGNGGGATRRVRCTVTPSTRTSAIPVTINQCNGSGNGGGALVICTASITNNIISSSPSSTPPASTSPSSSPTRSTSPSRTPTRSASPSGTPRSSTPRSTSPRRTQPRSTSSRSTHTSARPSGTASAEAANASRSVAARASRSAAAAADAAADRSAAAASRRASAGSTRASFVAPAGLTGDTPTHRGPNPVLLVLGLGFLAASLLLILRRSVR